MRNSLLRRGALALVCLGIVSEAGAVPARSDRELYRKAEEARTAFLRSPAKMAKRRSWEAVIAPYQQIVMRYPQSGYCDNALFAIGDLYRRMGDRFKETRYQREAAEAFLNLATEYPSSSLSEPALFAVFEITQASGSRADIAEAAKTYVETFPDGDHVAVVKAALRRKAPEKAAVLPTPPPPGLAQVYSLRFWSGQSSTRVVLELEREVAIRHERITAPERLYIDLEGSRLHPNLKDPLFPVGDGLLEAIRLGLPRPKVVRVVLDFKNVTEHNVFYLQDPPRLVIDVKGQTMAPNTTVAAATPVPAAAEVAASPSASPTTPVQVAEATPSPTSEPTRAVWKRARPTAILLAESTPVPTPTIRVFIPTATATSARGSSVRTAEAEGEPEHLVPTAPPRGRGVAPASLPQPNLDGRLSPARQFGLGAERIVIDAGHGGHDPGTIGHRGLQEKDLVLDVALRLEKLIRTEMPHIQVVMTRASDVFIPLEERTGIANSKGADLFLSIHANSSRSPKASGIETYFLNFAADRHAEEVAARENAISSATLKDLQGLVKAIALNSKISESRDFATCVQESLVASLRARNPRAVDRGVHTAPFYVLIGANMPSVLAEISFLSHPEEEKLLKSPEYRDRIARSLLEGVRAYLHRLSPGSAPQLTALSSGSTVTTGTRALPPVGPRGRTRRSR
jgi:N-acetylmuramoyl-L-alanine amidase